MLVALASFSPTDPAFSRAGGEAVTNAAGPVGAWLADVVFQVFGLGAWCVAGLGLAMAIKLAGRGLGGGSTGALHDDPGAGVILPSQGIGDVLVGVAAQAKLDSMGIND